MTARLAAALLLAASLARLQDRGGLHHRPGHLRRSVRLAPSDPANCGACGRSCGAGRELLGRALLPGQPVPAGGLRRLLQRQRRPGRHRGRRARWARPSPWSRAHLARLAGDRRSGWRTRSATPSTGWRSRRPASPPTAPFPTVSIPVSGPFSDLEFLAERNGLLYVSNAAVGSLVIVDPAAALRPSSPRSRWATSPTRRGSPSAGTRPTWRSTARARSRWSTSPPAR